MLVLLEGGNLGNLKKTLEQQLRNWSKSIGGGGVGPEQTGGESSGFEPLVGGGLFHFELPLWISHPEMFF